MFIRIRNHTYSYYAKISTKRHFTNEIILNRLTKSNFIKVTSSNALLYGEKLILRIKKAPILFFDFLI